MAKLTNICIKVALNLDTHTSECSWRYIQCRRRISYELPALFITSSHVTQSERCLIKISLKYIHYLKNYKQRSGFSLEWDIFSFWLSKWISTKFTKNKCLLYCFLSLHKSCKLGMELQLREKFELKMKISLKYIHYFKIDKQRSG